MQNEHLTQAEELLQAGYIDAAQEELDAITEKSGRVYFLQSRVFKAKKWVNEERKQLELAIKSEPENEEYKAALQELEKLVADSQLKEKEEKEKRDKKSAKEDEGVIGLCCATVEAIVECC